MRLLPLAARNAGRHPLRTTLTCVEVAVAVVAFVALRTTVASWEAGAQLASAERLGTRNQVSFTLPLPRRYVERVRATPGVRAATFANWFNGRDPRDVRHYFTSLAVDGESYLAVYDEIDLDDAARARWLGDRQGAILGAPLAARLGVREGDTITLRGTVYPGDWRFTVSGVYRTRRESVVGSQLLFHWARLDEAVPEWRRGRIGWIASRVEDADAAGRVAQAIDRAFAERDVRTLTMSEAQVQRAFLGLVAALLGALDAVSLGLLAVLMLIVGNGVAMGVRERAGEHAVLRALGFRPRHIFALVVTEALLVTGAGAAVGLLASWPIVERGLGRWLEANLSGLFPVFRVDGGLALAAAGGTLLCGAVAALLPAVRAMRVRVAVAMRRVGE